MKRLLESFTAALLVWLQFFALLFVLGIILGLVPQPYANWIATPVAIIGVILLLASRISSLRKQWKNRS